MGTQLTAHGVNVYEAEGFSITCMTGPKSDLKLDRGKSPRPVDGFWDDGTEDKAAGVCGVNGPIRLGQ